MALRSRQRLVIEALAFAATVFGSGTLLVASCLAREHGARTSEPPFVETTAASPPPAAAPAIPVPPPPQGTERLEAPVGTTTLTSADAGIIWAAPISGMAAHSAYDPELNPVTPNAFGVPKPPPQVPREPDAGE